MANFTLDRVLATGGLILTIILIVLDKAGKLRGPVLLWLLAFAAAMTLPVVFSVPWISSKTGKVLYARRALMASLVGAVYIVLCVWIAAGTEHLPKVAANMPITHPVRQEPSAGRLNAGESPLGDVTRPGASSLEGPAALGRDQDQRRSEDSELDKACPPGTAICEVASGSGTISGVSFSNNTITITNMDEQDRLWAQNLQNRLRKHAGSRSKMQADFDWYRKQMTPEWRYEDPGIQASYDRMEQIIMASADDKEKALAQINSFHLYHTPLPPK